MIEDIGGIEKMTKKLYGCKDGRTYAEHLEIVKKYYLGGNYGRREKNTH